MSNLEGAMGLMIQTFHKYSGKEGDKYTLSKAELKDLLTNELGNYLGNPQDKDAVDKVMKDLDANRDGQVDFTEFIILVGALTVACNEFFKEYQKQKHCSLPAPNPALSCQARLVEVQLSPVPSEDVERSTTEAGPARWALPDEYKDSGGLATLLAQRSHSGLSHPRARLCLSSHSANMPSDLERTMETLITVFHRYADKDGDSNTLSKRELKELMEKELSSFLKSQKDPGAIDKIMRDLDQNGDGQVSFEEFVSLVVGLSIACEQCYQLHIKKQQGKK
ncbi:uncharacterized protein [Lepisosteus oculatus]|uniref:uncharacterized protein n=1 Tax=Lepisosteus oculatus TaxID=7918 RepID=UPI003715AD8D